MKRQRAEVSDSQSTDAGRGNGTGGAGNRTGLAKGRSWRYLILLVAGVGSFATAALWGRSWSGAVDASDDLLAPRVQRGQGISAVSGPVPSGAVRRDSGDGHPAEGISVQIAEEPAGASVVVQDPFADLSAGQPVVAAKAPLPPVAQPAPPPPTYQPPPPPTLDSGTAALPFTVVGGISGEKITQGQPVAFLRYKDEVLVVRPGDEIEHLYRIESVSPAKIEIRVLSNNQLSTLDLGP